MDRFTHIFLLHFAKLSILLICGFSRYTLPTNRAEQGFATGAKLNGMLPVLIQTATQ